MKLRSYVPSLRPKKCEFAALNGLPPDVYGVVTPRIVTGKVWRSRKLFKSNLTKLVVAHLGGAPILGRESRPFYLDCEESLDFSSDAVGFAINIWEDIARQGLNVIPVLTLRILSEANADQISMISEYFDDVAIRIGRTEARAFADDKNVRGLFRSLDLIVGGSTLIFDACQIGEGHLFHYPREIVTALKTIGAEIDIDKAILSSSAFPVSVSTIGTMKHGTFPRNDLRLWEAVVEKPGFDEIEFGDYGTIHRRFKPGRIPARYHRGTIKYTSERSFHVFRGKPDVWQNRSQYFELAAMLVGHSIFRGADYGYSERATVDVAKKKTQPGNPQVWTTRALLQHIVFVCRSINEGEAREAVLG